MDARRVMRRMAAALAVAVTTMLVAPNRAAAASSYRWIHDGNGSWTVAANWQHLSGPVGSGYPNAAGDLAIFDNPFTANHTVTINQFVTIGLLDLHETHNISFFTSGAGGIIFRAASGSTSPPTVQTGDTGQHVIGVPVILAGDVEVRVAPSAARLVFTAGLSQDATSRLFTKRGPGTVYFFSLNANTYTGTTHVMEGTLELQHLGGALAINGPLRIGGSTSPVSTATVLLREDHQIVDTGGVRVDADGSFLVGRFDETIGPLLLIDGYVSVGGVATAGRLSVTDVTMSGGGIELQAASDLVLRGNVLAGSTSSGPAGLTGGGRVLLNGATRTFNVADGSGDIDLLIELAIVGTSTEGWTKTGPGVARLSNTAVNSYPGSTNVTGGRLELARSGGGRSIPTSLFIGATSATEIAEVRDLTSGNFTTGSFVAVSQRGLLTMTDVVETMDTLQIGSPGTMSVGGTTGSRLTVRDLRVLGGRLDILPSSIVTLGETLTATSLPSQSATIAGGGRLQLTATSHQLNVHDGQHAIDLVIATEITGELNARISKVGPGVARLDGTNSYGGTSIFEGTLLVNGAQPDNAVQISGGTLGGGGQVGIVGPGLPGSSAVAPGTSPGILTTRSIRAAVGFRLAVEITGTTPGSGYDQLKVVGVVVIESATLQIDAPPGFVPPGLARFVIVDNDGTDPIVGTFSGLAEGALVRINDDHEMTISYVGGDGNDVVLLSQTPPSYYLAEGATGGFFDDDVLIANPNTTAAPVTLTFLQEGGGTVVEHRTLAPQSRMTVHVDQIAGLENASPSVQVTSDNVLPLVVERTMFWDASYYGGHTANAVTQPQTTWVFAEGFQGFFDTYILIANANADATTATITFLRENDTPVVKTVPVAAFARLTVYAGDYTELLGRAFGIVVSATLPVIAERAMYFASIPGRLWTGGHANTGIAVASTSWFHAEGATGGFFNTFILLSNPQDTDARVDLRFLLDNGEVIARQTTIGGRQRLTINPAAEGDARLENAAVSTIVSSDVPIVSERSMYWPGDAAPFGEGHNSAGVIDTATRWGLAEGRVGGSHQFATYILLANPQTTAADVTITYLREGGAAPIAKTYTVPPTSRFNVDVGSTVAELRDESFGARIEVTNGVPIAVERSLYWNANGVFWAGGTNALATPLP